MSLKLRAARNASVRGVAFVLFSLTMLVGCKKEAAPSVEVSVQAEKPELGDISEHITADAVLTPIAQAAIAPKISAPVSRFYVQRGTRVKAGQLLVTLENADLSAAALDNKGSYEAAQAAYLTSTKAQIPEDVQRAQLDFNQAKANLDLNESIVKNRKQLFAEGAIPGRDLDTAQAALVQAQAAYDAAKMHLESVQKVSHDAAFKVAKGQLTSAEGKLKGAAAQVSYSEIRAPINGVVTDRPLFTGETAPTGTPLITVMDTSVLLAKMHIAQIQAQQLKPGDEAVVHVPGIDSPVKAEVSLISPALDSGSTTVEVWLKINNHDGVLKVGTPVKVIINGRSVAQAMKIPQSALLSSDDGSKSVMVIVGGVSHRKPVTLGIADRADVQILGGISASDIVITSGAYALDEGTRVKVEAASTDDEKPASQKNEGGN
ncbi:efflux RND transporter periplasmic adaptor subunit [Telmatobacter bradus]|uniref:efflux RND transporter periplasmic adaptor subunit n=1 Tax=Telmatobacter bradus TaxID=474953 RepID=UPI003B42860D